MNHWKRLLTDAADGDLVLLGMGSKEREREESTRGLPHAVASEG